jgi:hypothetical protein
MNRKKDLDEERISIKNKLKNARGRPNRYRPPYCSEKLFSLNSSIMDDNYDTNKTANIEINQLFCFKRLINYLIF